MFRRVMEVKALDNFSLECEMENGEIYKYDMSYVHIETGLAIEPLRDIKTFKQVEIEWGALEWPCGYGIHGDTVAREGKLISKRAA